MAYFDVEMRKQEHEFNLKIDDLCSEVLSYKLKVHILILIILYWIQKNGRHVVVFLTAICQKKKKQKDEVMILDNAGRYTVRVRTENLDVSPKQNSELMQPKTV